MMRAAQRSSYSFCTIWHLEAAIEDVWEEIYHSERWPEWWRYVRRAEKIASGDADGIASVWRFVWHSRLPYTLQFDMRVRQVRRPHLLEAVASGDLEGIGRWTLAELQGATEVRYDWRVRTGKVWMRRLAPLARPLFVWNHHEVMRQGGRGLAKRLGARLILETRA